MLEDVFSDMLRFVFKGIDLKLDLDRGVEFLDKEMNKLNPEPGRPMDNRFVDKLAKVYLKGGNGQCLKRILWDYLSNWRK